MTAEPLLQTEWVQRANDAVTAIAEALSDFRDAWYPKNATDIGKQVIRASVAHGFAGWSLFFAYYGDRARARELLERAIVDASESAMAPPLFEGLAGVAWTAAHLQRLGIVQDDLIGDDIDEYFLAHLHDTTRWQNPELVNGAAGIGLYALEHWPHGRSAEILAATLETIESAAIRDGELISWFVPPEQMSERNRRKGTAGWWDLGIAHGITGIALFLLSAMKRAPRPERLADLVHGAVRFIKKHELGEDAPSRFPAFVIPAFEPQTPSRLAWCYGDLCVALLFCRAGAQLGDPFLLDRGRSIARSSTLRQSDAGVVDASLCHGAVGVAHMFGRLASFDDGLLAAKARWLKRALDLRSSNGVAGFTYSYDFVDFDGSIEHNWIDNPGLLLGAAGIGLGLVSALSGDEPSWDRLFLLS